MARERRRDGRSDRRVIIDTVADAAPGTVYTYDDLYTALCAGLKTPPERRRLYRAVSDASDTLYRSRFRWLDPVPGVGYRLTESTGPDVTRVRFVRHAIDPDVFDVLAGDPPAQLGSVRRMRTGTRTWWRILSTVAGRPPSYNRFRTKNDTGMWLLRAATQPPAHDDGYDR